VSDFRSQKESSFPECVQSHIRCGDAQTLLSNAIINARIWYGNSSHVGDGRKQQFCIQNCRQFAANDNI